MTISEDARKMAAYIEEHGWWQGEMKNHSNSSDNPEVCLIGSAVYGLGRRLYWRDLRVMHAVCDYLDTDKPHKWNDKPGRTKEEVLEMLENVAIKHESDKYRSLSGGGGDK